MSRPRFDPTTHTVHPQHWRTITPQAAAFLVERIDESRTLARLEPSSLVQDLRARLLNTRLRSYPIGTFDSELDALLLVAGQASYSATTLLRYRRELLDLEAYARKLEAYDMLFRQRWGKQGAPTCEADAPYPRACEGPADAVAGPNTSSALCP